MLCNVWQVAWNLKSIYRCVEVVEMGVEVTFLVGVCPADEILSSETGKSLFYFIFGRKKLEKVWPYSILVVSAKPLQSAINNFSYKNTYCIFHLFKSNQYSSLFFIGVVFEKRIGHFE